MPRSPKIKREDILDTAFSLLLEEGYAAVSITALAQRMGCSTQPISWQFGGMEGLRHALFAHCHAFLQQRFSLRGDTAAEMVAGVACGYLELAWDYPHLYRHLYMSDRNRSEMAQAVRAERRRSYDRVLAQISAEYGLSRAAAAQYLIDLELYVHGMASYVAIGYLPITKQEALRRIESVSAALLTVVKAKEEAV